jgi:tetratricopeptide (TPR) repeat protein
LLPTLSVALRRIAQTAASDDALTAFREECHKAWLVGARRAIARREDNLTGIYLRAILAIEPTSREAIAGLSVLSRESLINLRKAIKKCDRAAAVYHAQTAVEINPGLVEAWFALARLTEDDDPERAAEYFRACVSLDPRNPYYLLRSGRSLEKADRLDEALMAYEQARASLADPSDPKYAAMVPAIAELRSRAFARARELLDEGRIAEAWAYFGGATAGSGDGDALSQAARAFLRAMAAALRRGLKENEPDLIAYADRFLMLEPDNKDILTVLGTALIRDRQFERAKEVQRRLTQISPDALGAYVRLARCCHALGHQKDGIEAAGAALRLDSTSPMVLEVAGLFGLAPATPSDGADGLDS